MFSTAKHARPLNEYGLYSLISACIKKLSKSITVLKTGDFS
ncbi:hypothetical protein BCM14_0295 [Jezberella montanilacus]|jgi:hypothetical protein|uniref:Uncharacterized protein n=1 Tax=Jezberella montanilacus TaxID=323426 RepID=A0A2T0XNG5_9BURK|nr:hypothetical protein BCM14_0295 [Jezberella montanilacus]